MVKQHQIQKSLFTPSVCMDLVHQQTSLKVYPFYMHCPYELLYGSKAYMHTFTDTQDRDRFFKPSKYMLFKLKGDRGAYTRCKRDIFACRVSALLAIASWYKDVKQIRDFCMIVADFLYIGAISNQCSFAFWTYMLAPFNAYVELMKSYWLSRLSTRTSSGNPRSFGLKRLMRPPTL